MFRRLIQYVSRAFLAESDQLMSWSRQHRATWLLKCEVFRYRCPLKPPVFPIRAVTIDTRMEGLSSLTYILLVALCAGDQINHILGFAVCLVFEFHWRAVGRLGNLSRCHDLATRTCPSPTRLRLPRWGVVGFVSDLFGNHIVGFPTRRLK